MVGLPRQVSGYMVIDAVFFKGRITQVSPQYGHHTQLMRTLKSGGDLFNLATGLFRTEIDRRAYRHGAHIERLLNAGVQGLIVLCRIAQCFVVIQFDQKRNTVRIAP
ncbi:Uncharacterised protein [Salmonella enterica subsp. enterica serovar Typhi]|nr:Uncharacterised protein [Salmonella enterica subsp. enterica serovar Typhi]